MKDEFGRRYLEVGPCSPSVQRFFEGIPPDACVECGNPVHHGFDRYFQRNDAADGTVEQFPDIAAEDQRLAADLAALTFDTVCESCGDKALRHPATS